MMWMYFTYGGWPGPCRHLQWAPKNFQYKAKYKANNEINRLTIFHQKQKRRKGDEVKHGEADMGQVQHLRG